MAKKVKRNAISAKYEGEIEKDDSEVANVVKFVASELKKEFGEGAAMIMGEDEDNDLMEVPFWVKTYIPALDYAIGGPKHPGIPGGRIIEVFGPESHGKTTLALWIMKCLVDQGGIGIYQDSEFALSEERVQQLGIDMSKVIYTQPEIMEDVFAQQEAIIDFLSKKDTDAPIGIFWDSVAGASTKSELEGDFGDAVMGIHARIMSQALRKIKGTISKQNVLALYINQIRDKMVSYGEKTSTFGGRALKFYSSVRVEVRKIENLKKGDGKKAEFYGIRVQANIKKNKVAPPFKKAEFTILFDENLGGVDHVGAILEWLKENELIGGSVGFYEVEGKKYRLNEARDLLLEDKKLYQKYCDLAYTV